VTLGPDGALLADSGQVTRFPAHEVEARDTTGAGDTVTGVLAASMAQGRDLPTAVRRAVAAAALAVTREGARAGMPTGAEIDRLLQSAARPRGSRPGSARPSPR
jgi:ribokinase